jgi:hypothetical protein
VTLHADHLNLSIPGAQPFELGLVNQIMAGLHDGFKAKFPEIETGRIDVASYGHLDLGDVGTVSEFLNRFSIPKNEATSVAPAVLLRPRSNTRQLPRAENGKGRSKLNTAFSPRLRCLCP